MTDESISNTMIEAEPETVQRHIVNALLQSIYFRRQSLWIWKLRFSNRFWFRSGSRMEYGYNTIMVPD